MSYYTIGVDFGTLSARAVLVDTSDGTIISQQEAPYRYGVLSECLPNGKTKIPPQWALQNPDDYLASMEMCVSSLMRESKVDPACVKGIACDFTSCTILPVDPSGEPLCRKKAFRDSPHAYAKLWKHHAAQEQARRIEQLALERGEDFLAQYGGRVSSQWFFPKALQIVEEAPEITENSLLMEAGDWITMQLTGKPHRSVCAAGFKRFMSPSFQSISDDFLTQLSPRLHTWMHTALHGELRHIWEPIGTILPQWAEKLNLSDRTVVGASMIDAHSAVLGSGIAGPGKGLLILGTSACQLLLHQQGIPVPGICGYVSDAIVPGYYAYEAGQACVGDLLAWFVQCCVPQAYWDQAARKGVSIHCELSDLAKKQAPGENKLVALDWWNGQRTPLVNDDLSGVMVGMTLNTRPEDLYRALLESLAFGTRWIFDTFSEAGLDVKEIVACGGIAYKNPFMMQIYADVLNRPIRISNCSQSSALGAAIAAAVASGLYQTIFEAVREMTSEGETIYMPQDQAVQAYRKLYDIYLELSNLFGKKSDIMNRLTKLERHRATPLS